MNSKPFVIVGTDFLKGSNASLMISPQAFGGTLLHAVQHPISLWSAFRQVFRFLCRLFEVSDLPGKGEVFRTVVMARHTCRQKNQKGQSQRFSDFLETFHKIFVKAFSVPLLEEP